MATNGSSAAQSKSQAPKASSGDFLGLIKGKRVYAKLNDGQVYAGSLICIDGNLNVVLENVTLFDSINEAQDSTAVAESSQKEHFSEVFIRGNNVCYIAPAQTSLKDESSGSPSGNSGSSNSDEESSSSAPSH